MLVLLPTVELILGDVFEQIGRLLMHDLLFLGRECRLADSCNHWDFLSILIDLKLGKITLTKVTMVKINDFNAAVVLRLAGERHMLRDDLTRTIPNGRPAALIFLSKGIVVVVIILGPVIIL